MSPHTRPLAITLFENERTAAPYRIASRPWCDVVSLLSGRETRASKSGWMIGAYMCNGKRCDANVDFRSLVQLDFDSSPPLEELRRPIDQYEWVATSTHGHDPQNGKIKYRITILPDRDIQPSEYRALLEGLDSLLGGHLDHGAFAWSQAFYLSSVPPEREADAFCVANSGAALIVDELVATGRAILETVIDNGAGNPVVAQPARRGIPETPENIGIMRAMLTAIPADCPRGDWRDVVWSVAATGWACARELARDWSIAAPAEWNAAEFEKVWSYFDDSREGAIGTGTVERIARQYGYTGPSLISELEQDSRADILNGQHFARLHRDKLLHVFGTGEWLQFCPTRGWAQAEPYCADRAAKAVVADLQRQAADALVAGGAEGIPTRLLKHVQYSSRAPNIRAMIEMAKSEDGMTHPAAEFDSHPFLLGVQNGVLDLQTGTLTQPTPATLVSKRCAVNFEAGAKCPRFERFLAEVQPEPDVREFLQRLAGYCLTGAVSEQVFAFLFGSGQNGKTVFIEMLAWLLRDYALKIPTEMLMHHQRNPQAASPDIVALRGVRLAYASETEEGHRLAAARVKEITGGDTLTGRAPYAREPISFHPSHKLILAGNHKPEIADASEGMWRRVLLLAFEKTIPEDQCDRQLLRKLQAEGAGILNWSLQGCIEWQRSGLRIPPAVRAATTAYRDDQDITKQWIEDRCVNGPNCKSPKSVLYASYSDFAKSNGYHPATQNRLTRILNERGWRVQSDKRTVAGLALKPFLALAAENT